LTVLRLPAALGLALIVSVSSPMAEGKRTARLERIGDAAPGELLEAPTLAAADTCILVGHSDIVWRIDAWVTGQELYKSLLDPASGCTDPYPFMVTAVNMSMMFDAATPLRVSVDIEDVDYTTVPGCPIPGVLLAISADYMLEVPAGGGYFDIWIPLDTPIIVDGPFFAGFYIANPIDPAVNAAVVTDSLPIECTTFNIWDESIGWIDLVDNAYYNFPGRLVLEASGIPGGTGGTATAPQTAVLSPRAGDVLYADVDLWCFDTSGSDAVDYASFEYSTGGSFVEITRDYDGYRPLRDGLSDQASGSGFSYKWDFSSLTEGTYTLRTTIYDTLGRSSSVLTTVYLEPTPPIPVITTPDNGEDICPPLSVIMTCADDNLSTVEMYRSEGRTEYSAGLTPMSQLIVGDANGNPLDGNLAVNGEYGTYYSGPVAATVALQAWADRGVTSLVSGSETMEMVAEQLAVLFSTRANTGTYDEDLYTGLAAYSASHGDNLELDFLRSPDYHSLRTWEEEEERIVILGLSGQPALYLTVDGFRGPTEPDSTHVVSVANPLTGTIQHLSWRDDTDYPEIAVNGTWQRVDVMISLLAGSWTVERTLVGIDFTGADGWSLVLQQSGTNEDSLYFVRAVGRDATSYRGASTVLVRANCTQVYVNGDYNDDRVTDIVDLIILVDFIARGGPPPTGGAARADANCDHYINITDVVYYINFLMERASPPCY